MASRVEAQILERLAAIETRLSDIDARTACTNAQCDRMGGHIDFVERAYGAFRRGLSMIPGMPGLPALAAADSRPSCAAVIEGDPRYTKGNQE